MVQIIDRRAGGAKDPDDGLDHFEFYVRFGLPREPTVEQVGVVVLQAVNAMRGNIVAVLKERYPQVWEEAQRRKGASGNAQ